MVAIYDCSVDAQLLEGMRLARGALGRGELVGLPTDTVYGSAGGAFRPGAGGGLCVYERKRGGQRYPRPRFLFPTWRPLMRLRRRCLNPCVNSRPRSGPVGWRLLCPLPHPFTGTSRTPTAPL